MSAQCRDRAFFKGGIDAAVPSVLRCRVGARQHAAGPLHRKSPSVKQFAHVAGMILNAEFLLDHPSNHGRRPDAAIQTVRHRTAVENVTQLLLLLFCQLRGPTRPIPFQQTIDSLRLITLEPFRYLGSRRLQDLRQFATGMSFRIQHYRAQPLRHAIGPIFLRFLAQANQSLMRTWMQMQ
jgi:hypothetical protein